MVKPKLYVQIQQSGIPAALICVLPVLGTAAEAATDTDRAFKFFKALVLSKNVRIQKKVIKIARIKEHYYSLECISASLPLPSNLHSNLHALIDIFRSPLVIYTKLYDVAVPHLERPTLRVRRTQPRVVQKRPTGAFGIFDEKFATSVDPYLCMSA